jgi:3-keto-disaccharide hydrolase
MKTFPVLRFIFLNLICALVLPNFAMSADDLVYAKDGSGTYGYKDLANKLPWCGWLCHDPDRPAPPRVNPGKAGPPAPVPSDAIVLFDGKDMSKWKPSPGWKIEDGCLVAGHGMFTTKDSFGSMQLHVEFMGPANFKGPWYNRGNNGVMLMGLYEIQIFDSYNEKIYPDGSCGAIYGQTPPLVNVTRPPGEWQTFDIVFYPPKFADGKLLSPARVTLFHNGVLALMNEEIHGETGHRIVPHYKKQVSQGPLAFGGHGCPVRFRDIWLRRL